MVLFLGAAFGEMETTVTQHQQLGGNRPDLDPDR